MALCCHTLRSKLLGKIGASLLAGAVIAIVLVSVLLSQSLPEWTDSTRDAVRDPAMEMVHDPRCTWSHPWHADDFG